ncbi:hypothetical protein M4951_13305 [Blastopirellula sp. J2-11]|uniref:hypothetical protein n=1 Tax=Blastopirellula sp. J2-11 TaxID=2943192 RepID=UPI0021C9B4A2|nr:hypothetical protein [Blastopirellula sp. J2-11]UUO04371.1 hypothetical protein M4951_13305 [Blastopirellula sp. J2-11]
MSPSCLHFLGAMICCLLTAPVFATPAIAPQFVEDFTTSKPSQSNAQWSVREGKLICAGGVDSTYVVYSQPIADFLLTAKIRVTGGERTAFGVAVGKQGKNYSLIRYYDRISRLELRNFSDGSHQFIAEAAEPFSLKKGEWMQLKVATSGDRLLAKIWPENVPEPDWQLSSTIDQAISGKVAIVGHDDTQLEVDQVEIWTDHAELASLQQKIADDRAALYAKLRLAAAPAMTPIEKEGRQVRAVRIVPFADQDRFPLTGTLVIRGGDQTLTKKITLQDYQQQSVTVYLPEPSGQPVAYVAEFAPQFGKPISAEFELAPYKKRPNREYVQSCLDVLLEHGRDTYGSISSPLFMAVLDADTRQSPKKPLMLGSLVRLEDRIHRRGERGSNVWYDESLRKALYRMSELTGDDRYAKAADDSLRYFFANCRKDIVPGSTYENGMPAWGTHVYWDCFQDRPGGDGEGNGPHEILVFNADWKSMYRVHPSGVRREIDGIWQHHVVDKSSGLFNRHDDGRNGCDFSFAGGCFTKAFAFMYQATGDQAYLDKARTVAGWHWNHRDPKTGLTPDSPGLTNRYDGHHCFTTVIGPHATGLLEAYRLSGDPFFRDAAFTYIKAYDKYGWNEEQQTYWGMLRLDGTPIPNQPKGNGYDAYAPYGLIDPWRTTIYSYEFTLGAAQAAVQAYETSVADGKPDQELLEIAKRWGGVMHRALPVQIGRRWKAELDEALPESAEMTGGYAEDYGRCISLFVHLYRATDDQRYLNWANEVADDAIAKLYHNGLFVGHPAKPYYETIDGVGLLLLGLLELDSPDQATSAAL